MSYWATLGRWSVERRAEVEELSESNPMYTLLGVREAYVDPDRGCGRLVAQPSPEAAWPHGGVHGGYLAALSLLSSEFVASSVVGGDALLVGVESSIIFLRQAEAHEVFETRSCVSYRTTRIIGVETSIVCGGEEVAKGIAMFLVEERG